MVDEELINRLSESQKLINERKINSQEHLMLNIFAIFESFKKDIGKNLTYEEFKEEILNGNLKLK